MMSVSNLRTRVQAAELLLRRVAQEQHLGFVERDADPGERARLKRQAIAGQHERLGLGRAHDRDQLTGLQLGRVVHQDFG